jgi:quinol monooxygenase YgiN
MRRAAHFAIPVVVLLLGVTPTAYGADEEHPVIALVKSKIKDEKKTFGLLVTFKVKEGNEKKFEEAFAPALVATRKEPGCVAYFLNRDPDSPNTYIMYESFKGIEGLAAHMKEKHTETLLKTVVPLCDGDPTIKVLQVP